MSKKVKNAEQKIVRRKNLKAGGYSLAVIAVSVAIAILVNMIISTLPSKYLELDISESNLYSLSDYSKMIAQNVDTDVTIYQLATKASQDNTIATLLDRYADLNKHIKVELRDPEISQIASQYSKEEVNANSLIFVSDKRSKVVDFYSLYGYSEEAQMYAAYGQSVSPDQFNGENEITAALDYVTTDVLPKVYVLVGHEEFELGTVATSAVNSQNIELVDLDLVTKKDVPDDCACLLVLAPKADISDSELESILTYLENGGRILVSALTKGNQQTEMTNFNKLLDAYGVTAGEGFVIEGESSSYNIYPHYLLPTLQSHEITNPMISSKFHVYLPIAQNFTESQNHRSSLEVTPLLTTSDSAYARVNLDNDSIEKADDDLEGPFDVAFAVSESVEKGETRAVIIASPYFLEENFISYSGNMNMLLNSLKWMCDLEDNINIVNAKSLSSGGYLEVPSSVANLLGMGITVLVPLALLATGIAIFVRRKKR